MSEKRIKLIKEKLKEYYDKCEELHIDIPESFIKDINDFNDIFVSSQITSINDIIKDIKTGTKSKTKPPLKPQITNAIRWCELYNLPINENCIYLK